LADPDRHCLFAHVTRAGGSTFGLADRRAFTFAEGVLKFDHTLVNADHLDESTGKVVSLLEEGL
jgi:hypothetical protein